MIQPAFFRQANRLGFLGFGIEITRGLGRAENLRKSRAQIQISHSLEEAPDARRTAAHEAFELGCALTGQRCVGGETLQVVGNALHEKLFPFGGIVAFKAGILDAQQLSDVATRIEGINPADLTRQINTIQMQLLDLAKTKTEALAAARHIDLEALQPSINRLAKAK